MNHLFAVIDYVPNEGGFWPGCFMFFGIILGFGLVVVAGWRHGSSDPSQRQGSLVLFLVGLALLLIIFTCGHD